MRSVRKPHLFLKASSLQELDKLWSTAQSRFLHVSDLKSSVGVAKTDLTIAVNANSKKKQHGQDPENANEKKKAQEGGHKAQKKRKKLANGAVYCMSREHHMMKSICMLKVV